MYVCAIQKHWHDLTEQKPLSASAFRMESSPLYFVSFSSKHVYMCAGIST
jgi:hypothetical protein